MMNQNALAFGTDPCKNLIIWGKQLQGQDEDAHFDKSAHMKSLMPQHI